MTPSEVAVEIEVAQVGTLRGDWAGAGAARPLVVFAHGSGSSRRSPRNRAVAARLQSGGLGTLLLDLLTEAEERVELRGGRLRFDVDQLADRLVAAVDWVDRRRRSAGPRLLRSEYRRGRGAGGVGSPGLTRLGRGVPWRPSRTWPKGSCPW